jgi:hypothetical protein
METAMRHRKKSKPQSLSNRIFGEFAYFENVPVFNKQQMHQKLLELDELTPWVGNYSYKQLRR